MNQYIPHSLEVGVEEDGQLGKQNVLRKEKRDVLRKEQRDALRKEQRDALRKEQRDARQRELRDARQRELRGERIEREFKEDALFTGAGRGCGRS